MMSRLSSTPVKNRNSDRPNLIGRDYIRFHGHTVKSKAGHQSIFCFPKTKSGASWFFLIEAFLLLKMALFQSKAAAGYDTCDRSNLLPMKTSLIL